MSKPKPSGKHQVSMKLTMKDPYAKTGILSVRALRVSYDPSESINSNNSELFKDFYSHEPIQ